MDKLLHWAPRILSFAFIAFLSLFALDVFTGPFELMMLVGLIIHLIPSLVLLVLTMAGWRWPLVGAIAFIGFALVYVWLVGLGRSWSWYAGISLPSLVVGLFYLADWWHNREISQNL